MKYIIVGVILFLLGLFANGQEEHELPFDIPQEENDYDDWWDTSLPDDNAEIIKVSSRALVSKECAKTYRECIMFLATNVVQGTMGCVAARPPEDEENYNECMKSGVKAFFNIEESCQNVVKECMK